MENKNIILILVVVIVILAAAVGVLFSQQMAKEKSNLKIADKNINVGDSLVVVLTDSQGNPIANETINVKLTDKDGVTIDEKIKKALSKKQSLSEYILENELPNN